MTRAERSLDALLLLAGAIAGLVAFAYLAPLPHESPSTPPVGTVVLAQDGTILWRDTATGVRIPVTLDAVSPAVIDATIAAEDQRFWQHPGIDPLAMARALVRLPRERSGASTITQQLARTLYLNDSGLPLPLRKAREALFTLQLRYLTPAREIEALNCGFAISHPYSLIEDPGTPVDRAHVGDIVRVTVTVVVPQQRNYVLAQDFLPAGLEPIDTRLDIVDPALIAELERERRQLLQEGDAPEYWAPWHWWYYDPWRQVDFRDDRVELHAERLPGGVHQYIYFARATVPGTYFVAPAHVAEGFFPDVFGRSDSGLFVVVE